MTIHEVRSKALGMLSMRRSGSRLASSDVLLRDGTQFNGVLIEHSAKPGSSKAPERLGFSLDEAEIRYVPIDTISEF